MLIHNTTAGVIHLGDVATLLPGVNKVEDDVWNGYTAEDGKTKVPGWKGHKMVKIYLEEGMLKETSGSGLEDMEVAEAVKTASATTDVSLLRNWKMDEKRKPVLAAIEAQEKKLALPEKK